MKTIMFFILSLLLLECSPAWATAEDAQAFFKTKLDNVLLVLKESNLDDQAKKERVMQIIIPVFDLELMAKLSVGKKYWSGFSNTQKQRFTDAFRKRLQASYLGSIMKFTTEEILYQTPLNERKKIYLPLKLISGDTRYEMLYKLYESQNTWKIYDVEIEGVSIIRSYRAQINEILGKADFEELVQRFEKPSL
ncbi:MULTISPECIES: Tgt2/MlaC family protein [Desulfobacula]|uniref:Ttg2: toluene tolerance protein n=2 Tax=Desulfobacula TaxID=28222 RepID=K0NHA1_DESTT|nr:MULTISPECIES: ABC transporter substrate-binding protein [Desulfobacula]CCK80626.1 Ttg2: toluene tolerance protein [Desulfobacula toluolica Tol2]SDT94463.1 phospholipid transport system substrate-binding protein [Desulfobacula phenolica]